jgi:hypothetical protein
MMKKRWLFLIIAWFFLIGCATKPGPNLASKSSLIHPQSTTKSEILQYFGPPVQVFVTQDGKEEWYYYYRVRNFWEDLPIVRNYKGEDYTEVLKIVFQGEVVEEAHYYTVKPPHKK